MATKMSITRALVELKTLNNRIIKAVTVIDPVTLVIGKNSPRGYKSTEEFETKAKADFASADALIKRRAAIKGDIVKANAITMVTIAGKSMSIAQAIEKKNSIKYDKSLLERLSKLYFDVLKQSVGLEAEVEMKLQRLLEVNFGKESKAKTEEFEAIAKPFKEANQPRIIDPLDLKNLIEKIQKEISEFEGEVDFILSEANAKTEIEVEA